MRIDDRINLVSMKTTLNTFLLTKNESFMLFLIENSAPLRDVSDIFVTEKEEIQESSITLSYEELLEILDSYTGGYSDPTLDEKYIQAVVKMCISVNNYTCYGKRHGLCIKAKKSSYRRY